MSDEPEAPLERARHHLQRATLEGLAAARALLEAAAAPRDGARGSGAPFVAEGLRLVESVLEAIRGQAPPAVPREWLEPVVAALESEIARWEARARKDPEARAVLRTLLGLRELTWELERRGGPDVDRRSSPRDGNRRRPPPPPSPGSGGTRPRVQRFDVEH